MSYVQVDWGFTLLFLECLTNALSLSVSTKKKKKKQVAEFGQIGQHPFHLNKWMMCLNQKKG